MFLVSSPTNLANFYGNGAGEDLRLGNLACWDGYDNPLIGGNGTGSCDCDCVGNAYGDGEVEHYGDGRGDSGCTQTDTFDPEDLFYNQTIA